MFYEIIKFSKIRALSILLMLLLMLFAGCVSGKAVKKKAQEDKALVNLITAISMAEGSESTTISIQGKNLLTYTSVKRPVPLSVTLYFPETALGKIKTLLTSDSDIVESVKASELTESGHTVRIEILLKKDIFYKVTREGNGLQILFPKTNATKVSDKQFDKQKKSPEGSSSIRLAEVNIKPETVVQENADINPAFINRIDFSSEDAGKSSIIIGTTKPVNYKINKSDDKSLQLVLFNTNLPDYRKRPLITTRFNSAVDRITPIQPPSLKNDSMITIELRESVPYHVEQTGDLLMVNFEASSIQPKPVKEAKLPAWEKVLAQAIPETEEKADDERPRIETTKQYTGEKIALDFYDTDIKNVFRILMEISGKNFAIDKDVTGRITLTLSKPVPWDQALDLILKMNQLGQTSEGDIIRIATIETLKKEGDFKQAEIIATQKAREDQKALEPLVTEYISVNYSNAETEILPHLEKIISNDAGTETTSNRGVRVTADKRTNTIIITDIAEKIEEAREIVKKLDKVTPQVMIEARIVEASDKFSREIGVNWDTGTNADGSAIISSSALGADLGYNAAVNFPFALLPQASAATMGFSVAGSQFVLNAAIDAYETQGDLKVVSSPKIITLDNKKAIIKQGASYPYQVVDSEGNLSTEYKEIELVLEVTPHVTSDKRISMTINIIKDDVGDSTATSSPWFTTKEATTELLVDDGNTIVIGGVIKTTKHTYESGVPWLSKIPVLGWLFKTEYKKDYKEELLIFITPKIVQLEQQNNNKNK